MSPAEKPNPTVTVPPVNDAEPSMIVTFASKVTGGLPAVTIGPTTEVVTTGGRLSAKTVTASGTETLDRPSTSVTTNDTVRTPTTAPAVVENVTARRAS